MFPRTLLLVGVVVGCTRAHPAVSSGPPNDASLSDASSTVPSESDAAIEARSAATATVDAAVPWTPPPASVIDGPRELVLVPGRPIYYARLKESPKPRLVAHLHGVCGGPSYACGKWIGAGVSVGTMVCPTGNAKCNDSPVGPPSWEAPTWQELVGIMDADLEQSIAKVEAKHKGAAPRANAILTGYSRGAFAAAQIARSHPNRWPYLVLIEANAPLAAAWLRKSGVRAVALVAGERGEEIVGMRKTEAALGVDGFPARLFVMKKTAHPYSEDMEDVMHAALEFVLEHEPKD